MSIIAFIGLGNMGGGMAANLAKAGHKVLAFDLSGEAMARAGEAGCEPVSDAAQAVTDAEVVITMLPAGKHVESVYAETIIPNARKKALLMDCSTIDVATARKVAQMARDHDLEPLDAPVSGGIAAANGGTLTFMVGASADGFARGEPILADMGKAVIHAGDNGAGQAAKICNNMLLGSTMAATCETFVLAKKLGLDLQKFYDIASVSSGQSWSMTSYCPVEGVGPQSPADNGYKGGFAAKLMLKDMNLALEAGRTAGASTPMGNLAQQIYDVFVKSDEEGLDFSAIIKAMDS